MMLNLLQKCFKDMINYLSLEELFECQQIVMMTKSNKSIIQSAACSIYVYYQHIYIRSPS